MEFLEAVAQVNSEMGFDNLKVEAISAISSGKDVLVCLPIGYRKSVIYGILPMISYDKEKS